MPPTSDPAEILQRMYDSEINFTLRTVWQGGFWWEVLDSDLEPGEHGIADSLAEAAQALAAGAVLMYPLATFSGWWRSLGDS